MARERTVKYPPKRGKLKRSEVKLAVEKVVYARRGNEKAEQTQGKKRNSNVSGAPHAGALFLYQSIGGTA